MSRSFGVLPVVYRDIDSLEAFAGKEIQGVHAYCFYKGKLVVVYSAPKGYWSLPGGGVEGGDKKYIDWGKIGDRLISRALDILKNEEFQSSK